MSWSHVRRWWFRALILALNVAAIFWIRHELLATPAPRLRILAALPAHDVDSADRFTLVFDESLPISTAMGAPLPTAPFDITPRADGHWAWAAQDRLEYVLHEPLQPGRSYTLRATAHLETELGRTLVGDTEFRFDTRPLRLERCDVRSSDRELVTFQLGFNQPVHPADLLRDLAVTDPDNETDLRPRVLTADPGDMLVIQAGRPDSGKIVVNLHGKLTGHGGNLPVADFAPRVLELEEVFRIRRADVETPGADREVTARIEFTHPLDTGQPVPDVNVSPQVEGLRVHHGYDGELILKAPFLCGQRYVATLGPEVLATDGKTLGRESTIAFTIPDRHPSLRLTHGDGILSPFGNLTLDIQASNIPGVEVNAFRIYPNNLVPHLHGTYSRSIARVEADKNLTLNLKRNEVADVALDLREIVEQPRGIYHVFLESTGRDWAQDGAVVTITDLGITAKRERDGMLVWVTSLRTGEPVGEARVSLVTHTNQVLSKASTDADGVARIPVSPDHPDGEPWVIVVEHGDDLSHLIPGNHIVPMEDVDQSGRPIPVTYDVMLYTERGVYRPGDTIHLTGIVRDASGDIPPAFPLWVRVTRPDGRAVAELEAQAAPEQGGMFQLDFPVGDDDQTGPYRFKATLPGTDETLGETFALVEAFMPVRIEVEAAAAKDRFTAGEPVEINVNARYLFGKPAAGLTLKTSCTYTRRSFTSKTHPDFRFDDPQAGQPLIPPDLETTLDDQGRAIVTLQPPAAAGLWEVRCALTVTETAGRSVSRNLVFHVDTSKRHAGIRMPSGSIIPVGQPLALDWIVLSELDVPLEQSGLQYRWVRVERDAVLEQTDGRFIWKTVEHLIDIEQGVLPKESASTGVLALSCETPGEHRLRLVDPTSELASEFTFHASGDLNATQPFAMDHPEWLDITLDRESYVPGTTARAIVRSPFAGTLLLTLENDHVLHHQIVDMIDNIVELEFPVSEQIRGGAFVSATVIRAVDPVQKDWLPHRAIGLARLMTDHQAHRLTPQLIAPDEAAPGENVIVTVQIETAASTEQHAFAHLWAVDEGILMASNFASPDPYAHFLGARQAGVDTADLFGDLLPDHQRPEGMFRLGADIYYNVPDLRRNPVPTPHREPAVVWNQIVPVSPDGTAQVEMTMPDLRGRMRLMAVVVDGDRYGSAARPLELTQPIIVEFAGPRFVAPGDRFHLVAKLFNSTDAPLTIDLDVDTSGPIDWLDAAEKHHRSLTVNPAHPQQIELDLRATDIGLASIRAQSSTIVQGDEAAASLVRVEFPVRPASPLHTETRVLQKPAGELLTFAPPEGFQPGTTRTEIRISASPQLHLQPAVQELMDYPYGCVEQTTSRLFAILHAPELLASDNETNAVHDEARRMIAAGIDRLWSMQTRSGGLGYWPGATYPDAWGTMYAAQFLTLAIREGYTVDLSFRGELLTYLEEHLRQSAGSDDALNTNALACYVLCSLDRPQVGWVARLSEQADKLDMAGRAQLALAWSALGRHDRAMEMLSDDVLQKRISPSTGGRITSQLRQEAVLLDALLTLQPDHAWIPVLAERLNTAQSNGRWGNTLENATAIAALSRYQLLTSREVQFEGVVKIDDQSAGIFDHSRPETLRFDNLQAPVDIESSGTGHVYVCLTTRGLRLQGMAEDYDHQLQVRRNWYDANHELIDPAQLEVGDLVHVETTIKLLDSAASRHVENVAIVDALPGGLEIENPRLATSADLGPEGDEPDHVEFLDDRVVLFCNVTAESRTYRYALRVVTPGAFILPPIEASCMYDAAIASIHGGGQVIVEP